ncbi:NAD(P)/FAD-dependent oxidoreductase [Pararhodonellum marinum]|uniref:NAD(P)/FAD-dependent oxidoreductase n=1 Tax=Pararhodonellum marinum TaxID=2755358 RepID=UPI00188DD76B|nr:NAD(P)/FAD-dependent oxidoreductase [Pararhodonellum marinum]
MKQHDVLIVGGGLAGLVAAHQLAKGGREVLLIEKKSYPFHRVCGEYISNEVRDFLEKEELFPFQYKPSEIRRFRLTSVKGKVAEAPLDMGGFGVSRYLLDRFIYEKSLEKGASFLLNTQVEKVHYDSKNKIFKVDGSDGSMRYAKHLIGAFGKRSKIDKSMNRDFMNKRSPYIGVKYHIKVSHEEDMVALHNFDGGYCGINKIENDLYNLCYLGSREHLRYFGSIPKMETSILYQNPQLKRIFEAGEFVFDKPEVINEINFSPKKPIENHVLMTGDAAGLITPLCGNGMAIAIHTGKLAAEAILQNRSQPDIEYQYLHNWNRFFKTRLWVGRRVQQLFGAKWTSEFSVGLLKRSPYLAQQIIQRTHGDQVV